MVRRGKVDAEPAIFDTELVDMPAELRWREWMNRIEAVLFAAPRPVEREVLGRVIGREASIDLLIDDIREDLRGKPYDVVLVAGGWQFRTRIAYADVIKASAAVPERGTDLTQTEAMVLVSIAYHQPITRGGVAQILGREVSRDIIAALREKAMITAGPRSPTPGAPFTYVTTKAFLQHFQLETLRELPNLEALEDAGLLSKQELLSPGDGDDGTEAGEETRHSVT